MSLKIAKIHARQVLDSRGNPTIETTVSTHTHRGTAIVPSGASVGDYEAVELRDHTKHYHGKSVTMAISNVNRVLNTKLKGMSITNQTALDGRMIILDGTENKSRLGANAILSVSMASARCAAAVRKKPLYTYFGNSRSNILPVPFCNIVNGGKHSGSNLQIQEFMIVPTRARSFAEATMFVSEIYHTLKAMIERKYGKFATNVGDEGGFAPPISSPRDVLELVLNAVEEEGYREKVKLAIDAAASEFFNRKLQRYEIENKKFLTGGELVDYYLELIKTYPIVSLEDPFEQDDFHSYRELTAKVKGKIPIIGDDLLATNIERIRMAIQEGLCTSLLLKPNQIGTLTESIAAAKLAMKNKWTVMVSHRSGETEDTFIADLAVALKCGRIKFGAPCRGERTAKFNRLLKIEEELGKRARYARL